MRDFRDAKAMAKTLREALSAKSVALTTSESQELVARILAFETGTYWPREFNQLKYLGPRRRLTRLSRPTRKFLLFPCGTWSCSRT